MPGLDIIRFVFSKRTCYRVYAILALLTRLLIRLLTWVLEVSVGPEVTIRLLSIHANSDQDMLAVQEFEPWVKWVMMDAALAYFVGVSARHYLRLAHFYQAIGWL